MAQKTTGYPSRRAHLALELGRHIRVMKKTRKNEGIERNGELLTVAAAIVELSRMQDRGFVFFPPCPEAWDTSDGRCPSHEGEYPARS